MKKIIPDVIVRISDGVKFLRNENSSTYTMEGQKTRMPTTYYEYSLRQLMDTGGFTFDGEELDDEIVEQTISTGDPFNPSIIVCDEKIQQMVYLYKWLSRAKFYHIEDEIKAAKYGKILERRIISDALVVADMTLKKAASGYDEIEQSLDNKYEELYNELREKYDELLYQVAQKYPNESRHETAKRYIHERENRPCGGPGQAKRNPEKFD